MIIPTGATAPDDARAQMATATKTAIADAFGRSARASQIRDRQAEHDARRRNLLIGNPNVFAHP